MKFISFWLILLAGSLFLFPIKIQAAIFNPNFILSDNDLEDQTTMSLENIQDFLLRRGSLGILFTPDTDGRMKTAAEIIWRIANAYRLNPQFLIALIQKEQGLVEGKIPTDAHLAWAAGYAVCDKCDKDHPELQPYAGFANQLEAAAKRIRDKYLSELDRLGRTFTGWGPDISRRIKGGQVRPVNRATAALYTYTPHLAGNRLLWSIWNKWFLQRYPNGSLLTPDDPKDKSVWLINSDKKHRIVGRAVLLSRFDPKKMIFVPKEELARYEEGASIKFPDFSILEDQTGALYLTRGQTIHRFASREAFRQLGFSPDEIITADASDLAIYLEAEPITIESVYPLGALFQNSETGGVYYLVDGVKHPIWSREILRARFAGQPITGQKPIELKKYPLGEPVRFADGELIGEHGRPTIYLVSNSQLRPIVSAEVFLAMGWRWENVVWTNAQAVSAHKLGEPINLKAPIEEQIEVSSLF